MGLLLDLQYPATSAIPWCGSSSILRCRWPLTLGCVLLMGQWRAPAWPGLLGAAYIGLFEMGITYVLWQWALRYAENTAKVGNLIFISRSAP